MQIGNYEPIEIVVRKPCDYVGSGNHEQKITIMTKLTEEEIMKIIKMDPYIQLCEVCRI